MKRWIHAKENIVAKLNNSAEHYTNRIKEAHSIASSKIDVIKQFLAPEGRIVSSADFSVAVTQAAKALGYVDCACFTAAGILSAMLDNIDAEYTLCIGTKAKPEDVSKNQSLPINHCWIEFGDKIYEVGGGSSNANYFAQKETSSASDL